MDTADRILIYPDPLLRQTSAPVTEVTPELAERVQAMFPLMYEAKGIGLAAAQVGWHVRLFVVNLSGEPEDELVVINPEIMLKDGGTWSIEEGCLSLPGINGKVKREKHIVIQGVDLEGEGFEIECDGMIARVILHEYDHLDGVLFIDRLSTAKKQSIKRKLRVLEEEFAAAAN